MARAVAASGALMVLSSNAGLDLRGGRRDRGATGGCRSTSPPTGPPACRCSSGPWRRRRGGGADRGHPRGGHEVRRGRARRSGTWPTRPGCAPTSPRLRRRARGREGHRPRAAGRGLARAGHRPAGGGQGRAARPTTPGAASTPGPPPSGSPTTAVASSTTPRPPRHCLEAVVAEVGAAAEVYVDGGVRNGRHVLTALALGARAVFLGRPPAVRAGGGRAGRRRTAPRRGRRGARRDAHPGGVRVGRTVPRSLLTVPGPRLVE